MNDSAYPVSAITSTAMSDAYQNRSRGAHRVRRRGRNGVYRYATRATTGQYLCGYRRFRTGESEPSEPVSVNGRQGSLSASAIGAVVDHCEPEEVPASAFGTAG